MNSPSRTAKLTAKHVNALSGEEKPYRVWDTEIKGFYVRVSPKAVKTYRYFYRLNKKPVDASLGRHGNITADIARDLAKDAAGQDARRVDIVADREREAKEQKREKAAKLGVFLKNHYQPWAEVHLKAHKETMRVMDIDFKHLHTTKMTDITAWKVQKWSVEASKGVGYKGPLSDSSINRRVADLKRVLSKAAEWGLIENSPLAGMKRIKVDSQGRIRYLKDGEESSLRKALDRRQEQQRTDRTQYNQWRNTRNMDALPLLDGTYTDHLKPMVILAMNTGMRRGEIFTLQWRDIELKGKSLTVQGATSKSSDTRYIPLNNESFSTLVAWRNQSQGMGLVFPSPKTGGKFDNIYSSWANLIEDAKISDFRFHDLRHHFASKLVMAKVPLNTVRELLGHSSLEMTLKYAHLAPEHTAAAVAMLDT